MHLHPLAKFFRANLVRFGQISCKIETKVIGLEQIWLDLGKFYWIWAKSKSCLPKIIWSPTAVQC